MQNKETTSSFKITLLVFVLLLSSSCISLTNGQPEGWKMRDRWFGFRYQIHLNQSSHNADNNSSLGNRDEIQKDIKRKAESLACFGWTQFSPSSSSLRISMNNGGDSIVGEIRCNSKMGPMMKQWLLDYSSSNKISKTSSHTLSSSSQYYYIENVEIKEYENSKIKLHFSHFKILDSKRETCFVDVPHQCAEYQSKATTGGTQLL